MTTSCPALRLIGCTHLQVRHPVFVFGADRRFLSLSFGDLTIVTDSLPPLRASRCKRRSVVDVVKLEVMSAYFVGQNASCGLAVLSEDKMPGFFEQGCRQSSQNLSILTIWPKQTEI